jgi:hypothetical protein
VTVLVSASTIYRTRQFDPNAPLIFEALELFASYGPRVVGQRQNFAVYSFEHPVVKRIVYLITRGGRFHALVAVPPVGNAFFFPARNRWIETGYDPTSEPPAEHT